MSQSLPGKLDKFTYTDLFAGVGGFAAALNALGGKHVLSAEVDGNAASTYLINFGIDPTSDVRDLANSARVKKISTDVVAGGFPCQPFSKSGKQQGTLDKIRGTLFENILHFVNENRPKVLILENVRNLVGPRHLEDFRIIIHSLRELGYRVSDEPALISPHLLPIKIGGRPQYRPRVYITATYNPTANSSEQWETPKPVTSFHELKDAFGKIKWNVLKDLPIAGTVKSSASQLSAEEFEWISTWEAFLRAFKGNGTGVKLPGFPLWTDVWLNPKSVEFSGELPEWKADLVQKNRSFYEQNRDWIDTWLQQNPTFENFPGSRRKFEWQAGLAGSVWDCAIQLRPSGLRVKELSYLPALVAVNQSSIIGPRKRRVSVRESARLQGFPEGFSFETVSEKAAYKQMGNAVHIGSVAFIMRQHVQRDRDVLIRSSAGRRIVVSVESSHENPDEVFESWIDIFLVVPLWIRQRYHY